MMMAMQSPSSPSSKGSKPSPEEQQPIEIKGKSEAATEYKRKIPKWLLPLSLVVPYVIGLAWHVGLHPVASVFTGDFSEARRWYIDENSLDPSAFRMNKRYNLIRSFSDPSKASSQHRRSDDDASSSFSLCRALWEAVSDAAPCQQTPTLELVSIVPSNALIAPSQEAIVVVVPFSSNWFHSQLHYSILQLIKRLCSPEASPWMGAKTILLAAPRHNSTTLYEAVEMLLHQESSSFLIRNVLVLTVDEKSRTNPSSSSSTPQAELRLLPQGRRGVLPNMDLVFLFQRIYSHFQFSSSVAPRLTIHRHSSRLGRLEDRWLRLYNMLNPRWIGRLLDLLGFECTLANPQEVLPHVPALERGIDSLTLELAWDGSEGGAAAVSAEVQWRRTVEAEVVSKLEPILRALCNLHERLHHSTRLYLLVSPERFVKHEEYLVPNLLLLIPLIVRAVTLICLHIQRLDLPAIGRALWCAAGAVMTVAYGTAALAWLSEHYSPVADPVTAEIALAALLGMPYLTLLRDKLQRWWYRQQQQSSPILDPGDAHRSVQFVACLLALYMHVAIAFGHVSLAFPSAALYTPLIAFPSHSPREKGIASSHVPDVTSVRRMGGCLVRWSVVILTSPSVAVPVLFGTCTPYGNFLYVPLHVLVTLLWL